MTTNDYEDGYNSEQNAGNDGFPEGMTRNDFLHWAEQINAPVVEMRPAFQFTCENCGRDGHISVVLRETRGDTNCMVPAMFKCKSCGTLLRGTPIVSGPFPM
jgi:DNA-directed RNA polymerase subunit M/transcription elongation factor TFIIS